jgi:septal ring factor EnvC (AmiA/AmiB activator)
MLSANRSRAVVTAIGLFLLTAATAVPAQENPDAAELEQQLDRLRTEIEMLQRTIEESRTEYRSQQDQLKSIELAIQSLSRGLRDINRQLGQRETQLAQLLTQRTALLADLGLEQEELAELIRSAYQLGYPSRLKLMLNQDDLSGLSRNLAYYHYFNEARVAQIGAIRTRLADLEILEERIAGERRQLEALQAEQAKELDQQNLARDERREIAGTLAGRIAQDQKQLEEMLRKNRRDLEKLLERLSEFLVDIPAGLGQNLVLSRHKGQLPAPLQGRVLYAFGNERGGGLKWQGWLYSVAAGNEVRSIAYGRVAFSDWLRGYGLLMILDHGDGFMSLYGHNDSLLRDVGDWVQAGEVISLSGASGGLGRDGLYFELRKDGKALDPSGWISR